MEISSNDGKTDSKTVELPNADVDESEDLISFVSTSSSSSSPTHISQYSVISGAAVPEDDIVACGENLKAIQISSHIELPATKAAILIGHKDKIYESAWNPSRDLLATACNDNTARIWDVFDLMRSPAPLILSHDTQTRSNVIDEFVVTLDWNCKGTHLATGSSNSIARIWKSNGELVSTLSRHVGAICSVKWNKCGNYILSGGFDGTAIIWGGTAGQCIQRFSFHDKFIIDVDWKSDTSFASCSADTHIHVCQLGSEIPIKTFQGHTSDVNVVRWCPQGKLLASASDDKTIKIWSMNQNKYCHDLLGHSKQVYAIDWSPIGLGTQNSNTNSLLASGSHDSTVRLWDVERGLCIHTFTEHTDAVFAVKFSPDGKYLATGSFDNCFYIWDTQTKKLIHSYKGTACISSVSWNANGTKIAASSSDGIIYLLDIRNFKLQLS